MQMYVNSEHKKAQLLMDEQKFEQALSAFNKALDLNPNNPDILSHRGVAFLHLNQKKKCFDDLELSLRLDKSYSYRYACLAYAKEYFGDLEMAIELYEKAVEVDPDDAISHNNLGLLREKQGYQKQAERDFNKADKLAKIQKEMFEKMNQLERDGSNSFQAPVGEPLQPKKLKAESQPTFKQVSKDLLLKRSVFKEFLLFVKNGFKLHKK